MKYSGVEWIGNIPDNWELKKVGQLFNIRNEKVSDKVYSPLSVSKSGVVPQMETVAKSDASDDRKLVLAGDFAINSRSDRKMSCGVSPLDGSVSLINTVLYPKVENMVFNDYMNFLMKNYGFAEEFYRWGHGIVADLWTTKWQEMKSIFLPLPPVIIQEKINKFLNKKSADIDSLIGVENQQIEKLKEYKQTVITDVVTKGLDRNASMKDSGIDYIGNVPKEWMVRKLKSYYKMKVGFTPDTKNSAYYDDEGAVWVSISDLNSKSISSSKGHISQLYIDEYSPEIVKSGSLLYAFKLSVGKVGFANCDLYTNEAIASFIPEPNNNVNFLYYSSFLIVENANTNIYGAKILNQDLINNSITVFPPLNKQKEIVDFLDKKCAEIDTLISAKQKKIDKLNEYKKSLIYEYVTGKKEVIL